MAERTPRKFEFAPAVRDSVPLFVGLFGASGSGKTMSALELATGIAEVCDGPIAFIDTENRRGAHYADRYRFSHSDFRAPYASLDYLDALRAAQALKPAVTIVDSMSHEHESVGGMLDYHERELDRLAGSDFAKRERVKMLAWQKPKAARRTLLNGLMQLSGNFIFCFRAKETAKPVKKDGKTEVVNLGFMPIAGDEFVFEMTVCFFLPPASRGVPLWTPENVGEKQMLKLPVQFQALRERRGPIDAALGRSLAKWAKGGGDAAPAAGVVRGDREGRQVAADAGAADRNQPQPRPAPRDRAPSGSTPRSSPERAAAGGRIGVEEAPAAPISTAESDGEPCWEPMAHDDGRPTRCGLARGHKGEHTPEEDCF